MTDDTTRIRVISPEGKGGTIPASSLEEATKLGWKTEEQANQEKAEAAVIANRNEPEVVDGKLKLNALGAVPNSDTDVLQKKFLNQLTNGLSDIVAHRGETPEEAKLRQEKEAATEAEHPILSKAAPISGFVGSLLTPGIGAAGNAVEKAVLPKAISEIASKAAGEAVAKQATISAGRQFAGKVVKNMAMAELYNAPAQIANLAIGDPNQAAESLGWTITLGGLLGAGEHGFSKYITPIAKSAAAKLPDFLDQSAISQAGIDATKLHDTQSSDILNLIKKEGKVGSKLNPQSIIDDRTSKIQSFKDLLDNSDMDTKSPILSDTQQNVADKMQAASPSPISDHLGVNPDAVKQQFMTDVLDSNPSLFSSEAHATQAQEYSKIKDIFDKYGAAPTSFENVNLLKKELDSLPDGQTIKVNGKEMNMKEIAKQYLQTHEDAQMAAGLNSLDNGSSSGKISEYLAHQKDLKTAQMMQNPNVQLPISKTPWGAAIGGTIGGAIGAHIAGPFGVAVGAAIGSGGNATQANAKAIISAITKKAVLPFGIRTLSKLVETAPEMFGNALARAANNAVDSHLSNIKDILFSGGKNLPIRSVDALASVLGDEKTGLSKDQQYQRLSNNITKAATNPESIADNLGALTSAFGDNPHLQNLVAQHNLNAITYLNSILPKNPNPMQAFSKNDWQASPKEKNDFLNQLAIVDNPMIAVHKAAAGTLTSKEVTTLQTVYPVLYQKISGEITKVSFSKDAHKIPNHTKVSSSVLTQQPLLPSLQKQNAVAIQSTYNQSQPTQSSTSKAPRGSSKERDSQGSKLLTSTQKDTYK